MSGSVRRQPIRKPFIPQKRKLIQGEDGKTWKEHLAGYATTSEGKLVHTIGIHRVRENPRRVPRDRVLRTRGQHRRVGLTP